jgi:DNA-binding winged helix-turn-helix (wHTH) protein
MDERPPRFYEFGAFRLDADKRLLWRGGETVPLVPKAFDVLMASVWRGAAVEENSLNVNVSALRKAFGERPHEHRFIVTVPGVGYKFVADVCEVRDEPAGWAASTGGNGAGDFTSATEAKTETASRSEETSGRGAAGSRLRRREARRHRGWRAAIAVGVVALSVAGFIAIRRRDRPDAVADRPAPFQTTKALRLTTSGNATGAAISPDGKYVVYELDEGGKKSLWLRQVDVASALRLTAPDAADHYGLTFSRDGNYIYYLVNESGLLVLYQMTVLGQAAKRLIENVGNSVSLSPDGRRIAFFRQPKEEPNRHELLLANADGRGNMFSPCVRSPTPSAGSPIPGRRGLPTGNQSPASP